MSSCNPASMIISCDCLDLNVLDCSETTSVAVFIDSPSNVNVPLENPVCIENKFNNALIADICSSTRKVIFIS